MYVEFLDYLLKHDKEKSIMYCLDKLNKDEFDLITLYEDVITKSLNDIGAQVALQKLSIWDEHVSSAIVRSCIENCFLYLKKQYPIKNNKTALVVCPQNEQHEIGALIVNDFLSILGFNSYFLGANTPLDDIILALEKLKCDVVAISISNYYNLIAVENIINIIKDRYPTTKVILGGTAVEYNKKALEKFDSVHFANSFNDIKEIVGVKV